MRQSERNELFLRKAYLVFHHCNLVLQCANLFVHLGQLVPRIDVYNPIVRLSCAARRRSYQNGSKTLRFS